MVLEDWTTEQISNYGKRIQTFPHHLSETGLFTDDALAALLDRHPKHLIDVCTMEDDPDYPNRHCTVDPKGASGTELMKAAKSGAIWINIREAMSHDPLYRPALDAAYADLEARTGQSPRKRNRRGGILISSPVARVPYHCDPTQTLLWHIRGRKRVYVYPANQRFLPDEAYEAILLGEQDQDVPYRSEFDAEADIYDLPDNTLVCWPHTSPHRVVNQGYCISMVMEFTTAKSAQRNGAMFFNGLLRRRLGLSPHWQDTNAFVRSLKAFVGHLLRKLGAHRAYVRKDIVRYELVGGTSKTLSPCPPFTRNF